MAEVAVVETSRLGLEVGADVGVLLVPLGLSQQELILSPLAVKVMVAGPLTMAVMVVRVLLLVLESVSLPTAVVVGPPLVQTMGLAVAAVVEEVATSTMALALVVLGLSKVAVAQVPVLLALVVAVVEAPLPVVVLLLIPLVAMAAPVLPPQSQVPPKYTALVVEVVGVPTQV